MLWPSSAIVNTIRWEKPGSSRDHVHTLLEIVQRYSRETLRTSKYSIAPASSAASSVPRTATPSGISGSSICDWKSRNAPDSSHVNVARPWNVLPGNIGCAPMVVHSPIRTASAWSLGFACMPLLSSYPAQRSVAGLLSDDRCDCWSLAWEKPRYRHTTAVRALPADGQLPPGCPARRAQGVQASRLRHRRRLLQSRRPGAG